MKQDIVLTCVPMSLSALDRRVRQRDPSLDALSFGKTMLRESPVSVDQPSTSEALIC
ncbi:MULTISPECIES: hypothetical protein [unclassified Bradyrhizobium]|uniref:hypothetical protein n=1 Tax=unclassified Bradyrhizobium TaxID=2631580 RepID=UPI0028F1261C|nr:MULTISPECIES: hypothetical protein [unclassified Bradyrhizobium]